MHLDKNWHRHGDWGKIDPVQVLADQSQRPWRRGPKTMGCLVTDITDGELRLLLTVDPHCPLSYNLVLLVTYVIVNVLEWHLRAVW